MDVEGLIQRARSQGRAGIREQDRRAIAYRPGAGRVQRRVIADRLLESFSGADLPLLRALMIEETMARREHGGCGRVLYALATMLFALGKLEDLPLVYNAKYSNMDAGSMIDSFFLTMQQDHGAVIAYLKSDLSGAGISPVVAEEMLSEMEEAFTLAERGVSAEELLGRARAELSGTYGDDLFDEDEED
jgi:hypothetical protein